MKITVESLHVSLHNARSWHRRVFARYLRRHGWVVFYLEPEHRHCSGDVCWLALAEGQCQKRSG